MENYSVVFAKPAVKELGRIDSNADRERILERIGELSVDPRPAGTKKLKGFHERYRIRQGDYRILYEIRDRLLIVTVIDIGHRKDIYRRGRG